jgi:hypothetical protein
MEQNLRVFGNLESLQADFPGFVIWGETIRGRVSYVAEALEPGVPGPPGLDDAVGETTGLCEVARKLRRDRERQAEAALGVGPPFP